jgi:hypothetical protein
MSKPTLSFNNIVLTLPIILGIASINAYAEDLSPPTLSVKIQQSESKPAISVDLSSVPQENAAVSTTRTRQAPKPRIPGMTEEQYKAAKAAAARPILGSSNAEHGGAPLGSAGLKSQTPGAIKGWLAQVENGSTPSDMALAVSQKWVVQAVNSSIAIYDKNGTVQAGFPKALASFIPGSSGDLGDPRAFYDWSANRFVVVVDDFTNGVMYVAASRTSDPRGAWWIYGLAPWGTANCRATNAICPDFPQVGFDDQTIYVGVNLFLPNGGFTDEVLVLPKAKIYAGAGL